MERLWQDERWFRGFWLLYISTLGILILTTPLSPSEAKLFYRSQGSPEIWVARFLYDLFPSPIGLRIVPFALGILSLYLFYRLLGDYFPRKEDRRLTLLLYALLPGVIVSMVLLNDAIFALTLTLLFLQAYRKERFGWQLFWLLLLLSTDTAVFSLYLAVAIYAWKQNRKTLAYIALFLMAAALTFGLFDVGGRPRGHLPELFGIYAALFSPLFFVYYFYALYRTAFEGPRDLYWTIAFTALVLSILLSIRQQILIVDFSPYLIVGTMIPVAVYLRSLRVRMRRFQRGYRLAGGVVVVTLVLSSLAVVLHRPIYDLLGRPANYFAAPVYRCAERAERLKREGRRCYRNVKKRYDPLMRFYGLHRCAPGELFSNP
jgi:MFS family permease